MPISATPRIWGDEIGLSLPPDYMRIRGEVERWASSNSGPLIHPLLSLQKRSVAHAVALRYCCIFDDMGLGKTAQSLAINAFGGHKCTFVLCPNNVKKIWIAEILKFLGVKESAIYVGKGAEIVTLPPKVAQRYKFIIFNYESFVVAGKTPDIIPAPFQVCNHHILDEVHYFRNAHSDRFISYFNHLVKRPPHRLTMLSGTPIDRCITDAWPYLAMLDLCPSTPRRPFLSYFINSTMFAERYANPRQAQRNGRAAYGGYREETLPEVGRMFGGRVVHRKIEEIVELKPLRIKEKVIVPAAVNEEETLLQFKRAFALISKSKEKMKEWEKGENTSDMFLKIVQRLRHDIAVGKTGHTIEIGEEYYENYGPTIIFSEFIEPVERLSIAFKAKGLESVVIRGDIPLSERYDRVSKFKEGRIPFLIATYGVLSEGENLQMSCSMILNDLPWQPLVIKQAQRRIWRIGQDKECFCYIVTSKSDHFVQRALNMKGEMIAKIEADFANAQKVYKLVE